MYPWPGNLCTLERISPTTTSSCIFSSRTSSDGNHSGQRAYAQLRVVLPARGTTIHESRRRAARIRPGEDQTTGRRAQSSGNFPHEGSRVMSQRIAQLTVVRAQPFDGYTLAGEPIGRHARGQHQGSIRCALVSEEVQHRAYEIGCDPRVRHVAHEARLAQLAPDDLGPLIPGC